MDRELAAVSGLRRLEHDFQSVIGGFERLGE
jgi:hypothetical protein